MYLGKGTMLVIALVAGRELMAMGWLVVARFSGEPAEMKPLPLMHWTWMADRLKRWDDSESVEGFFWQVITLDGLLGLALRGRSVGR